MSLSINTHSIDLEASSSQYLSRADGATLSITGNLCIEAWVKVESAPASNDAMSIVAKYESTSDERSYNFDYFNNAGTLQLRLSLSTDGAAILTRAVNQTLTTGTWFHVAFSYTASSGTVDFIVNGVSIGAGSGDALPTSIYDSTADFEIGSSNGGITPFDGKIDEVRVWNTTRTAAQVLANLYIEIDSATNLQGSWHLDNALTDSSGNGLTLTNNNAATFSTDTPFYATWNDSDTVTMSEVLAAGQVISVNDTVTMSDAINARELEWSNLAKSAAGSITNQDKS